MHSINPKPNIIFNSELIYDLRYGKTLGKGINAFSNHALHIVTKDKNYKTTETKSQLCLFHKRRRAGLLEKLLFLRPLSPYLFSISY